MLRRQLNINSFNYCFKYPNLTFTSNYSRQYYILCFWVNQYLTAFPIIKFSQDNDMLQFRKSTTANIGFNAIAA